MNDLKYALRMLRKNPGFTAVAVLTLALGIGATTTVFSVVDGVLLKPLEFPGSDRIVHIAESDPEQGFQRQNTSPANFVDWRRESTVFEAISFTAEYLGQETRSFVYNENGQSHRLTGRMVATNYFAVFGLKPVLGRSFLPEEEASGARRVAVISHQLWHQFYEGSTDALGADIALENNGRHNYEIIGIMPEGFREQGADVWISCAHMPRPMTRRGGAMLSVVGRLKPGVSIERASAELNSIQSGIFAEYGHIGRQFANMKIGAGIHMVRALERVVGSVRPSLVIFSGAVALVLLIACANVANLLLSRALSRQREVALRAALGAGRWRIMRQLLCESMTLSLIGGAAGALLAHWGTKLIINFSAGAIPRLELVEINGRVLLFAILASLATGVFFGLAPAWQSSKTDLNSALKDGANRMSGGSVHQRLRGVFTVAQISLALTLLIGAGLLLRSFNRMQSVDTGFDTEELLTVDLTMTGAAYDNMEKRRSFVRQLLDDMRAVPGVESACFVSMIPDRGSGWPTPYARTDRPMPPPDQRPRVTVQTRSPDYARTYGIQLLRGREFTQSDAAKSTPVIIVNQAFADNVYPGEDPIGRILHCGGEREVVGVLANVKNSGLGGETRPEVYTTPEQWDFVSGFLTVRARSNPMALAPIVTDQVRRLNPDQPLKYFKTMQAYIDDATARPRFRSMVLGLFALTALVLASVGIYGVMAYSVTQRTHEMGVRMALGAEKTDVMKLVLRQGLTLTLSGVGLGLAVSLAINKVLEKMMFEIGTTDTVTFFGAPAVFIAVALAACVIPAMRAMRVHPMTALRYE